MQMIQAPSIDDRKKIMEYPDRRIKAIVLTMASAGLRLGAWDYRKCGNVVPIKKDDELVGKDKSVRWGRGCSILASLHLKPIVP